MKYGFLRNYRKSWDRLYSNKNFVIKYKPDKSMKLVLRVLRENCIRQILSVPCGDFTNEIFLAKNYIYVDGADISSKVLKIAERKAKASEIKNYSIRNSSAFSMRAKKFDAIMSIDFFVQLPDSIIAKSLKKYRSMISDKGFVFVNFYDPEDPTYGIGKKIEKDAFLLPNGIMMKYKTRKEASEIVRKCGFRIVKIKTFRRTEKDHGGFRRGATDQKGRIYRTKTHTHIEHFMVLKKS